MAYVSIEWAKDAAAPLKYVLKSRGERDVTDTEGCSPATAIADFKAVRREHNNEGGNQALLVLQSFSPEDSVRHTPEALNSIGRKLAEANFEGHQFVIRTHTDTEHHIHNHIVVNNVNAETGLKIENKRSLIQQLRDSSDGLCQEQGLSIINRDAREREARLPRKVQQMVRAGKRSYIFDLVQKADVARSIATNLDEYRDILGEFKIRTLIEEKNISYFYPGKERGKRGSKLGRPYGKEGLIEAFKVNHQKYLDNPELRSTHQREIERIRDHGLLPHPDTISKFAQPWNDQLPRPKNLKIYPILSRRNREFVYRSDEQLAHALAPISEIRRARQGSIFDYCERNKIALTVNSRGEKVIQGREFVVVTDLEFKNNKNGTRGTLIDLVAAHKKISLMQAVAHINNNPRLKLLEDHLGEVPRKFTSFHVPLPQRAEWTNGAETLGRFLKSFGVSPEVGPKLQKEELVHVDNRGGIRLFSKNSAVAALEFIETAAHSWQRKSHGEAQAPFYSETGTQTKAVIYTDPVMLLRKLGKSLFSDKKRDVGILGLLTPNERLVHQYVTENKYVSHLLLVGSSQDKLSQVELYFFENLRRKYQPFGLSVEQAPQERALQKTLERGREDFGLGI